jgi:transposase
MDMEQLKQDVAEGKVSLDRLVDLIASQQKLIEKLQKQCAELQEKIDSKNPTERLDEQYSEKAEEKRRAKGKKRKRSKPHRRGRITTAEKIAKAERTELVYPDDCDPQDCKLSHTRVAWRLEDGRAVLVAYKIYRQGNRYGQPPGVPGRCEFGMETLIALAYQVYILGLSLDKACQVLGFFQNLSLKKSQANALLNQLARAWEDEFDTLCMLLANAAVVYCDETGWSINSVWAFLTDTLTLMFYGVHKDGKTLAQILDKATFAGVLVSDDAAIYQGFNKAQKCWAHLLRKAIKLTLQAPEDTRYRELTDSLLSIYRTAKRVANDKRFGTAGREHRVTELEAELLALCTTHSLEGLETEGVEDDYRRLVNEIMRLLLVNELFVFVTTEGVVGNNNSSERELRDDAQRRDTGRTNKKPTGAKRQSIIASVLRTLGKQLSDFTLDSVITEIQRWAERGRSCFTDQAKAAGLNRAPPDAEQRSLLDRIILHVDNPEMAAA